MSFSSRDETFDTNTPSSPSNHPSVNGETRRKSSETIQSYQESISNSSVHTYSTVESADSHNDLSDLSGRFFPPTLSHRPSESPTGQYSSIFDHKSSHSLEKSTSHCRNQSLSSIRTTTYTREPNFDCESDSGSTTSPSTPKQEPSSSLSLLPLEDEAEISLSPAPRSPQVIFPIRKPGSGSTTSPSTPKQEPSSSSSLLPLEDEAEISLSPAPRSPQVIFPIRKLPSPNPNPSPAFAAPHPPLNGHPMKSYTDPQLFAATEISSADTPSTLPPPTDRTGTRSRARSSSTVTFKEKKGILGFLRKSVDFRDSNKRLEVSAPYDVVRVQHGSFNTITGKLITLPGKLQEFFLDNRISKQDQEKDSPATIEFSRGNNNNNNPLKLPRPSPPRIPNTAPTPNPEASKPVGDSLTSTELRGPRFPRPLSSSDSSELLPLPKTHSRAHSSGGWRRPNLDLSSFQQALPKLRRNDTPVRESATGDWRFPEPQASAKASPTASPVTERRAQATTAPQQQSPVAASLAKSAGATPRRRERKKGNKANDADLVKRLQGICKDADPTRLYRNLVKIGQE